MALTQELKSFVVGFYGKVVIKNEDVQSIIDLMKYDKKNVNGKVNFVLLDTLEHCQLDVQLSPELIQDCLDFYMKN